MSNWIKKTAILFWFAAASIVILTAVFGVALKSLTPVLNNHKASIEAYASSMLHADIHIESIQANWARFGPEVHFKGLSLSELGSGDKTTVLKADDLTVHIGVFRTIWRHSVYFRSIALSGTNIAIRETSPHQYLVNDAFLVDMSDQTASRAPDFFAWLISQSHIRLVNIHVNLTQLNKGVFSIELGQGNVYQSSKGLSIFVDGRVRGEVQGPTGQPKVFKSKVRASTWVGVFQQKLTFVEVEVLNRDLVLQDVEKIHRYPSLGGVFLWQPVGDNWFIQGKEVALTKAPGESSDLSFEFWRLPKYYAAHLNSLNLSDLAIVSDFLNLTPANFDLEKANVQGSLEDIDVTIPADFSVINQYRFSAALRDVSSSAYQALPELHHLSGAFSGGVERGFFMLLDNDDEVYFPHYFNQAIAINNLTANGQWNFIDNKLSLLLSSMHLISPVVEAEAAMKLEIPFKQPDQTMFSLLAQYDLKESQEAVNFLPMKEFNADFGQWLTAAVGHGLGSQGKVLIRGVTNDFPFAKKEGVFIVDGSMRPLTVSFSPEWPAIKNVSGRLRLHNQSFHMNIAAQDQGITITNAKIDVPNYQADDAILTVDLQAAGDAKDYLNYIHRSPLNATLGQWLSPFDLTGTGVLSLHLDLPLAHLDNDHIKVAGQWLAQGASFSWRALGQGIENIRGAISFTENSIFADHVIATLEKEPVQLSISTTKEKGVVTAIEVGATGELSVAQLKAVSKINWLSLYLSGRSHYDMHLRVPMAAPEYLVSFDTDLKGMKVNLPGMLGKEAENSVPLSLQASINPSADLLWFAINYTKNISTTIHVQHYSQTKNRSIQVEARAVAFSWPLVIPLPKTSASDSPSLWQSLTTLTLQISHLSLYKNDFSSVLLSGVHSSDNFSWKIQANEAQGVVVLPVDPKQPITANFDYLTLYPSTNAKKVTPLTSDSSTPDVSAKTAATWPAFFIDIHQFKRGKMNWGEAILQTKPLTNGIQFEKVQLKNKYHNISAEGQWINTGAEDETQVAGEFTTDNLGKFLSENDITQNFQAKAGAIKYNLRWIGSPMKFQLKTLEGDANIDVKNGVIPLDGNSAKMGLGKVLTLFSAQSIQRRFQLNFSDLGENGYSFNSLISKIHFQTGNAKVQEGTFDGPEAKIGFTGRLGLVKQDYDLYLVVTPYLTSSLPLIATLAGGPIAGVATYAFDKIAAGSIAKYTSYKYLLRGPWAQPQLISLDLEAEKKPEQKNIAPVEEAKV